jgi:hypothetical protein
MSEFILLYRGFANTRGWCHVVTSAPDVPAVLVGQLDDNPGTSVTNAIEEIAALLSAHLFEGANSAEFEVYEYRIRRLPQPQAEFLRVDWNGEHGAFAMPTWDRISPADTPALEPLASHVRMTDYTFAALTTERDLAVLDADWRRDVSDEIENPVALRARVVEGEEFRRHVYPTVEALRSLAAAVDDVGASFTQPSIDSQGLRELAEDPAFGTMSSWREPLRDTQVMGALTLRAAADMTRAFAESFDAERPPVWAHLNLAKSSLEASVVAAWLNEPGIAYEERIRRGLCERLFSAEQIRRLGLDHGTEQVTALELDASGFGWETSFDPTGKPCVGGTTRPPIGTGISRLVMADPQSNAGPLLWGRLGAVSEVTWWGLQWALMLDSATPAGPGLTTVPVGTDLSKVALQAWCVLRALRGAASARFVLMGWDSSPHWVAAVEAATAYETQLRGQVSP